MRIGAASKRINKTRHNRIIYIKIAYIMQIRGRQSDFGVGVLSNGYITIITESFLYRGRLVFATIVIPASLFTLQIIR